jgi:flagellar biogenesis protein FliO
MNLVLQNASKREPFLLALWARLCLLWQRTGARSKVPRLRLCESLSLGEKRFVAVVEFDTERFLIGGGPAAINLLARLGETADFPEVLSEWCERQR